MTRPLPRGAASATPEGADPKSADRLSACPAGPGARSADLVADIAEDITPDGAAALAAIAEDPGHALIALDFDGTLAPIVSEPSAARPLSEGRGYCLPWRAGRNQGGAGIRAGGES